MAIALVACGLALGTIVKGSVPLTTVATALAMFAGAIGTLTLSEHVFGWNLGIDELRSDFARGQQPSLADDRPARRVLRLGEGTDRLHRQKQAKRLVGKRDEPVPRVERRDARILRVDNHGD